MQTKTQTTYNKVHFYRIRIQVVLFENSFPKIESNKVFLNFKPCIRIIIMLSADNLQYTFCYS
jgi:hypothetical protein